MIEALSRFDSRTAAGVLARAALALEDLGNPAATPILNDERAIRDALLAEARQKLGVSENDQGAATIERLSEFLDEESEKLVGPMDISGANSRLIASGSYPTDLYEIVVIQNIKDFFGKKYDRERLLIERTIQAPSRAQHFGPPAGRDQPHLISLFTRRFFTPYPHKDFTMLVAGQRGDGKKLHVHQAWRLYDSKLNLQNPADLVDLLRRFAEKYGAEIPIDGVTGHFFLTARKMAPTKVDFRVAGRPRLVTVTQFAQADTDGKGIHAALITAIDLDKYAETLASLDTDGIRF